MYYSARLKKENNCNGCRFCTTVCPEGNAIHLMKIEDKSVVVEIQEERCKGCNLCVELCPEDALILILRE